MAGRKLNAEHIASGDATFDECAEFLRDHLEVCRKIRGRDKWNINGQTFDHSDMAAMAERVAQGMIKRLNF